MLIFRKYDSPLRFQFLFLFRLLPGLIFVLATGLLSAQSPQTRGVQPVTKDPASAVVGKTYAVIVGVSEYANENITDLKYAKTDAEAFYKFLRSPAGGSVPESQITFLSNEDATAGQVAAAFDGLLDLCKEGDRAVIYFSGHGDVERKTITQPGFLLCEDAPASVYMGGGTFPLIFLQEIVSTLSMQQKVNVIVFTDACRAGKLAGTSIGGSALTAANLAKQYANEVKILSCQPDELSLEGLEWGGGRGLFSYYLIHGMLGLADGNNDKVITVFELERYLQDEVSAAADPHSQFPMVVGSKSTPIAWVDSASLAALQEAIAQEKEPTLAMLDSRSTEAALGRDSSALFQYRLFKDAVKDGHLLHPEDQSAYTLFLALKDRPVMKPFAGLMRRNLAAAFQDEAQKAINDYLASEPAELRKRWAFDTRYERFPTYLEKAAEILGEEHYMYKVLRAREQYFRGLNLRLSGEQTKDTTKFMMAINRQNDALEWDPNAAYAYNELGLLERRLENHEKSARYFDKAVEQSPQWALPWTNLSAVYLDQEDFELAVTCGEQAARIDPSLPLVQYNLGVAYNALGQTENAIQAYQKALKLDPGYADVYFNLGVVFYTEGNLKEAAQLWEKYSKLVSNDPKIFDNIGHVHFQMGEYEDALASFEQALVVEPEYPPAQLGIAVTYLELKKYGKANTAFEKYLQMSPEHVDVMVYYFQSRMYAEQNDIGKALDLLEKACKEGFNEKGLLEQDKHMANVRNHPEYATRISECFQKN